MATWNVPYLLFLDLVWRTVDESKIIAVDPTQPIDITLFNQYDICVTGAAMKQFENKPSWNDLVQNTWVYARVSPSQKEYILTTLKSLGYITLMAGDGTNDVGALKQAHVGVALLDGTPEDLQKIAERQKLERMKKVYETQLNISARFNQPPPPVPPAIAHLLPDVVKAQQEVAAQHQAARQKNPMEKVRLSLDQPFCLMPYVDLYIYSSIWLLLLTRWPRWRARTMFPRSNSEMHLAQLLLRQNSVTYLLVHYPTWYYVPRAND